MPRVTHVKKARKDIPSAGIKKGESYYWWKFKNCGKSVSKTPPKQSQLTRSEFWQAVFEWQERSRPNFDDIESSVQELVDEIDTLKDELSGRLDNMPDGLREGPTGELLQERIDALESASDELGGVDTSGDFDYIDEDKEDEMEEAKEARAEEIWQDVMASLGNISCS